MRKRQLTILFLLVFINMVGFGLILPLLPYYAETFNASPAAIGFLVASFSAAQLVGTAFLGRLSDVYGRRPLLLLSVFGTFVSFLMLGFAQALWVLFASRIVDGLTGGNISIAQAYIADVTDEKGRARGLGLIGAAFGLGFIIGPAAGGLLSQWGYGAPALAAAGLSLINLIAIFFFLPESLSLEQRNLNAQKSVPAFDFGSMRKTLGRPVVGPLLYTIFFFGLAAATFQTVFSLHALYRLKLSAQSTGYILAYVGLLSALVQAVAIGWLTTRFSEGKLIFQSLILMIFSLLAWAFVPNVLVLLIVLVPLALSMGTLNTVLRSYLTKAVLPEEIGGILGLSASIDSLTRVVAPSVGGLLLQQIGTFAPGVFGALVLVVILPYVYRWLVVTKSADEGAHFVKP
jgi:DHA1 family tetracycline resistance protein-like MFS transporter